MSICTISNRIELEEYCRYCLLLVLSLAYSSGNSPVWKQYIAEEGCYEHDNRMWFPKRDFIRLHTSAAWLFFLLYHISSIRLPTARKDAHHEILGFMWTLVHNKFGYHDILKAITVPTGARSRITHFHVSSLRSNIGKYRYRNNHTHQ
jgi:hypothetical protein